MPPSHISEAHIGKMMQEIHSLVTTVNSINAKVDRLTTDLRMLSSLIAEDVETSQEIATRTDAATQLLQAAQNRNKKSMWERQPLPPTILPDAAPDYGQPTC